MDNPTIRITPSCVEIQIFPRFQLESSAPESERKERRKKKRTPEIHFMASENKGKEEKAVTLKISTYFNDRGLTVRKSPPY